MSVIALQMPNELSNKKKNVFAHQEKFFHRICVWTKDGEMKDDRKERKESELN